MTSQKKWNAPQRLARHQVEMAGIEPASEGFDPRKSTSVVGWISRHQLPNRHGGLTASRWSFGHLNGVGDGTLPLSRLLSLRGEFAGGRRRLSTGDGSLCLYCLRSQRHRDV